MNIGRLKHNIKQLLPYIEVLKYEDKHNFYVDFVKWEKSGSVTTFDEQCKFKSIVAVQGFGYSGSGAVVDLLREYDDCVVNGLAEGGSKAVRSSVDLGEVTFLTNPGGLIDIDLSIQSETGAFGSEVLNRFATMIYRNKIYHIGAQYREYLYLFFSNLIDDRQEMKGSLSPIMRTLNSVIYHLKPLSKQEYYSLCNKFLYSIFNLQWCENTSILVMDQMFASTKFVPLYNQKFIPNLKSIVVYRDPRDIYYIAKENNIQWLEHDSVEHFISRCKRQYAGFDVNSTSYLAIRFEDLVLNYDITVKKIEDYLGLGAHVRPQSCLDTSISSKNVGRWKSSSFNQSDFDKIKEEFPDLCYND